MIHPDDRPVVFDTSIKGLTIARQAYPQEATELREAVRKVPEEHWQQTYCGIEGFYRLWLPNIDRVPDSDQLKEVGGLLGGIAVLPEFAGRSHAVINRYAAGVSGRFQRDGSRPLPVVIFGLTEDGQLDYYPDGFFPRNARPESIDVGVGDIVSVDDAQLLYRGADKTAEVRYSAIFYNRNLRGATNQ